LHSFAIVDLTDDSLLTVSDTFGKLFKAMSDHGIEFPVNVAVLGRGAFDHIVAKVRRDLPIEHLHHRFQQAANNARNCFVNNGDKCSRALVLQEGQVHDIIVLNAALAPDVRAIKSAVMDTRNDAATHKVSIIGQGGTTVLAKIMYEVVLENDVRAFVPLHAVSSHYSDRRSLIRTPYVVKSGEPTTTRGCSAPRIVFKVEGTGRYYQENEVTITGTTSAVYEVDACDIECPAIVFVRIPERDTVLYSKVKLITNYVMGIQCKSAKKPSSCLIHIHRILTSHCVFMRTL
jgi:hypothetical protein